MKKNQKAAFLVAAVILSYSGFVALVMNKINYTGLNSYLELFKNVSWLTIAFAVFIQLFWILVIDILMGYLSKTRGWLPPVQTKLKPKEFMTLKKIPKPSFDEVEEVKSDKTKNDDEEFEIILQNRFLSPFAFLWKGIRSGYRGVQVLPEKIKRYSTWVFYYLRVAFKKLYSFIKEILASVFYVFFLPNLGEIIFEVVMSIMTKVVIPFSLLPLLLLAVPKLNLDLTNPFVFIVYFLTTGVIRLGIWSLFFYIRLLKSEEY